jgi:transcription termination factor Rho
MAAPDRSVLEGKPVTELKEIAKSLDVKVSGLKKSEIIEAISNGKSKSSSSSKASAPATPKPREKAPQAPVEATAAPSAQSSNGSPAEKPKPNPARDDSAMDDRDNRNDPRQQRRPQGRNNQGGRPREKAEPREGRGRRRRRNRGGGGGGQGGQGGIPHYLRDEQYNEEEIDDSDAEVRTGVLDLLPEGYGFLRTSGYLPGDKDVYVSVSQVRRMHLRKGDEIVGSVRAPKESEKYQALLKVRSINGMEPELAQKRPRFADLTPLYPQDRMTLEQADNPRAITSRI